MKTAGLRNKLLVRHIFSWMVGSVAVVNNKGVLLTMERSEAHLSLAEYKLDEITGALSE